MQTDKSAQKNEVYDFRSLETWKRSHELALRVYGTTRSFPDEEKFGLVNQLRRAASSVGANIAEGYGRYSFKDRIRFYHQARGSLKEVQNFLFLSVDLGLLSKDIFSEILDLSITTEKLLNGLIRHSQKSA
ncbi:four helix bundle protein [candidate division WWE3 bacterium]|uniref:Four helix bundle protein n=1 Tax=candidate division WWE3 bacterium TaxID=2053526 RepID=A0A955RR94_UNCKA|nr:four helix bundle protein [candidate division WWE3 bacterium]